jgi:hypothetical protein
VRKLVLSVLTVIGICFVAATANAQTPAHRGFLYADDYCTTQNNAPIYDQNCIQGAINAAPNGSTILVGPSYALTGASTHGDGKSIISINKPIRLDCGTWPGNPNAGLSVASNVATNIDVIRISGDNVGFSNPGLEGIEIHGCQILAAGGTPARYPLSIDSTNAIISKLKLDHNYFGLLGGGHAIYSTNLSTASQFFTSWIEYNVLFGGIQFNGAGDSIDIQHNVIPGPGMGVDVNFFPGAALLTVAFNNITTLGGCLHLGANASQAKILYNQCEGTTAETGSNGAILDIDGLTTNPGDLIEVAGNRIIPDAATLNALRVNAAKATHIHDNYVARPTFNAVEYVVTSNAVDTYIENNMEFPYGDSPCNVVIRNINSATRFTRFGGFLNSCSGTTPVSSTGTNPTDSNAIILFYNP